jgi:hypothetical protein
MSRSEDIAKAYDAGFRRACGQSCGCMDGEMADSHDRDDYLAKAAPSALPVGWQLVPVEPTEEMILAGAYVLAGAYGRRNGWRESTIATYRGMLSASPPEPVSGWRDIATAPRDTPVIVQTEMGRIFAARLMPNAAVDDAGETCDAWGAEAADLHPDCWTDGTCWTQNDEGDESDYPTHWMPLPSPPSEPGMK